MRTVPSSSTRLARRGPVMHASLLAVLAVALLLAVPARAEGGQGIAPLGLDPFAPACVRELQSSSDGRLRPRLQAYLDAEIMSRMLSRPVEAVRLLDATLTPDAMAAMLMCGTDPEVWDRWLGEVTDVEKMMLAGGRLMQPWVWLAWAQAPMDAQFQQALARAASPAKLIGVAQGLASPQAGAAFARFFDPRFYLLRVQWFMQPATWQRVMAMPFGIAR